MKAVKRPSMPVKEKRYKKRKTGKETGVIERPKVRGREKDEESLKK